MSAPADPVSNFITQHQQLIPYLLSSSAIGVALSFRKLGTAIKSILLVGLAGLAELQRGLCDFASKCDANWCRLKRQLAEHRRGRDDPAPRREARP
jgi:hypothetical protein